MDSTSNEGLRIQRILFLVFFIGLFLLAARLVQPFYSILLWAGLIYALTQPLYARLSRRKDGSERRAAARSALAMAFTLGSLLAIGVPLLLLSAALVGQVGELGSIASGLVERGGLFLESDAFASLSARLLELSRGTIDLGSIELGDRVMSFAAGYAESLVSASALIIKDAAGFVVALAFLVFILYFLYVDGRELMLTFVEAVPIKNAYTVSFLRKFRDTSRDLVVGYGLVAAFQGVMAFVVFAIMRVPAPLPLALLCALASFVPMVGSALVWLPVSLLSMATHSVGYALLLMALSAVFISSLDNFIRPLLLHARIKLHPLLIFMAIIGGLELFGVNGLLLGPIVLVMFFTSVDMFGKAYGRRDAPTGATRPEGATIPRPGDAP